MRLAFPDTAKDTILNYPHMIGHRGGIALIKNTLSNTQKSGYEFNKFDIVFINIKRNHKKEVYTITN